MAPLLSLCFSSLLVMLAMTCVARQRLPLYRHHSQHNPSSLSLHMFTGIVEEMGVVKSLEERNDVELWDGTRGTGTQLAIQCSTVLEGAYLGYVCSYYTIKCEYVYECMNETHFHFYIHVKCLVVRFVFRECA